MVSGTVIGIILAVGFLVVGGVLWLAWSKQQYKYFFLLFSRDGKHVRVLKARIKGMPTNNKVKKFYFKDSEKGIEIREPTTTYNGKPARQITYNNSGEYVYISDSYINKEGIIKKDKNGNTINVSGTDDKAYRVQEMEPVERELAARQIEDNIRRFSTFDKSQLLTMVGLFIFGLLFLIGIIYQVMQYSKALDTIAEIQTTNKDNINILREVVDVQNQQVEALLLYYKDDSNSTLIRELT